MAPRPKRLQPAVTKVCTFCEAAKPLSEFYSHPNTRDGKHTRCKRCWNRRRTDVPLSNRRRLAALDRQLEAFHRKIDAYYGHPLFGNHVAALRGEQLRRNRINGLIDLFERKGERRRGTRRALRKGRQPTVSEERRAYALEMLEQGLAKRPDDPHVQAYWRMVDERDQLIEALFGREIA